MVAHLSVGDLVKVVDQRCSYWGRTGQVVEFYGMISAGLIKRVKVAVRFEHARTKNKHVDVAYEIHQLDWMDSKFASYTAPVMKAVALPPGSGPDKEFNGMSDVQLAEYIANLVQRKSALITRAVAELDRRINRS